MSENNEVKEPLNKNNKVPKLRFDKFKNDNFNCDILSQIATLSKGNGLSKDDLSPDGNKCILYGELYTRYLGYIDTIISKTKTILSNPKLSKSGDIIMPLSGETPTDISNSAVVPEDNVILGGDLLVITPKKNIDPLFLSLYLSNCKKKEIAKKSCGISIIHSHKEDIAKLTIYYPSLAEQYYISTFLKKLTKKIDIVLKKIDVLKKYKKGIKKYVMKDTIKFWKTGIGNAIELKKYLIEKNEYCVKNGLYPHITLSTEGITDKSERYDRDFLVKNEDKKYKITHLNQLCYNPANLKFGVICINKYGNGIFSPIYSTFDINNIVIDYLELIITSNDFINYSMKYQQGTVFERMSVSSDDLCKIKIVTISFDEQQKIAKVADTLNKKISKLEDELLSLKHLKSTLLNDMFI